jgi:hypothetical protein
MFISIASYHVLGASPRNRDGKWSRPHQHPSVRIPWKRLKEPMRKQTCFEHASRLQSKRSFGSAGRSSSRWGREGPVTHEVRELRVKVAVAEEEFRGYQKELGEKTHRNDELHEQLRVSLGQEEGGWVERQRELREKGRGRVNDFQRSVLSKHEWKQYGAAERRARLDNLQRDLGGKVE